MTQADLTFDEAIVELHALIERWVSVAVYGDSAGALVQLAGFTGQLVAAVSYGERLSFRVRDDDPLSRSAFFLAPGEYRGGRWRDSVGEQELLIQVDGGGIGLTPTDADARGQGDIE